MSEYEFSEETKQLFAQAMVMTGDNAGAAAILCVADHALRIAYSLANDDGVTLVSALDSIDMHLDALRRDEKGIEYSLADLVKAILAGGE